MKNLFRILLLLALCCSAFAQTDIYINSRSTQFSGGIGLAWGNSGIGGINNNFVFSPQATQQNLCVYLVNNNPTSAHSFTIAAFQTGDPSLRKYSTSSGRWVSASIPVPLANVNAASTGAEFVHIDAGATISINISGATTQTGSPDTVDLYFVQTTSEHCGSVNNGTISVNVTNSTSIASYTATASGVLAASPTDFFTLSGSATKTVTVTHAELTCTQTTGAVNLVQLIKRTSADSGGTSSSAGPIPYDSNDPGATAAALVYSANPTGLGTGQNVILNNTFISGTAAQPQRLSFDFGTRNTKAVILRGTSQFLVWNLGGVAVAGASCSEEMEWTEQ